MKLISEACERNKNAILSQLKNELKPDSLVANSVLEIGSGSGQHAVYFAQNMPWLQWQPSDLQQNHASINTWRLEQSVSNCLPAIEIDLANIQLVPVSFGSIFTANTLHIVSWPLVAEFFKLAASALPQAGRCIIYGPFNYNNQFTSVSNAQFDQWLKSRDSASGIRDFEAIETLATNGGFKFLRDLAMPANNRLLIFEKC